MFFFRPQPSQAPVLRQRFLASPVVSPRLRCGAARRLPVTCRSLPVQPAVTSTAHNSTADTEGCRIFAPLRSCASRTASPKWVRRRNHRDLRGPSAAPSVPSEVLHARIVCLISAGRSPRSAATRSCGVVRRTSRVTGSGFSNCTAAAAPPPRPARRQGATSPICPHHPRDRPALSHDHGPRGRWKHQNWRTKRSSPRVRSKS